MKTTTEETYHGYPIMTDQQRGFDQLGVSSLKMNLITSVLRYGSCFLKFAKLIPASGQLHPLDVNGILLSDKIYK
jgi:hypothetical protein